MNSFDDLSEPLDRRLAAGLARLAAAARQLDWQAAEALGLSPTQADILRLLTRRPAGVRLAAAAAHAGVRSATASDAVGALERKELVRKEADPADGRAVVLKATPAGQTLAEQWPASFEPAVAGLDEAQQAALLRLVIEMIRHLLDQGLIAPQRTCVSCRFFRENVRPREAEPHACALVGMPMADRHLRVDCPEHEPIAA